MSPKREDVIRPSFKPHAAGRSDTAHLRPRHPRTINRALVAPVIGVAMLLSCCTPVNMLVSNSQPRGLPAATTQEVALNNWRYVTGMGRATDTSGLPVMHDWTWMNSHPRQPETCLAMSGGGIRSAAFNIGVLKALLGTDPPLALDAISGVSGGSYALSWYYVHQYQAHVALRPSAPGSPDVSRDIREKMFADDQPYQEHLLSHSRFFTERWYVGTLVANLLMSPVNLLLNGLFGWHANTSLSTTFYEYSIRETFLALETEPRRQTKVSLRELGHFARTHHLPFFVISATALVDDDVQHLGGPFRDSVFEFTPYQFGSDGWGWYAYGAEAGDFTVGRAVAISGAALDLSTQLGNPSAKVLTSIFNQDLGVYIDNPRLNTKDRVLRHVFPFPAYFLFKYQRDVDADRIYLTDGGHSDNLAVYPLVRRFCKHIVIVDAEEDRYYMFPAYWNLKHRLRADLGVDLRIEAIEAPPRFVDFESKHREVERKSGELTGDDLKQRICKAVREDPYKGRRWQLYADRPVMSGEIKSLPLPDQHRNGWDGTIRVTYLKLAYYSDPGKCQSQYNGMLQDLLGGKECTLSEDEGSIKAYYCCVVDERHKKRLYPLGVSPPFPQQPTTDQNFSRDQFRAYVDLGKTIGNQARELAGSIQVASKPVKQHLPANGPCPEVE
jgi:predicted acylesterase/phospholipase RssA